MPEHISKQMKEFLASQSPEQLERLNNYIHEIQASQAKNPNTQYVQNPMRKKTKGTAASRAKAMKSGVHPAGVILAAKRPLNSWMAFRAYYSTIFTTFQQKDISGFLTRMWREDLFKAKWALVAKAYSVIRDQVGKAQAPLDTFLQIVCPHVGIISPAEYLEKTGWSMPQIDEKVLLRLYMPNVSDFDQHVRTTNLSVIDLVEYCQDTGYFLEELESTATTSDAVLTMTAEPVASGNENTVVDAADFEPILAEEFARENMAAPIVAYEANNLLLAASGDSYPYNDQFEPDDADAGFGLYFNANGGDQFNAFDVSASFNFDEFLNEQYDLNFNGHMNLF